MSLSGGSEQPMEQRFVGPGVQRPGAVGICGSEQVKVVASTPARDNALLECQKVTL
jgi:hypothetical protein